MTVEQRQKFISGLTSDHITMLAHDWGIWARDNQWPPEGAWRVWLIMAGRGFAKHGLGLNGLECKPMANRLNGWRW